MQHLLTPDRCFVDLRYGDKAACLGDLAKRAAVALKLDRAAILAALTHRETLGSTGLGNAIALPHARVAGLAAPFVLLVKLRTPLAFEALDGRPVDIVCLVLATDALDAPPTLARVAKRLRDPATLARVRAARTADELYAAVMA